MKVGILSDTHGQVDLALSAAREFIFRDIDVVLHCGDIGSEMVLTEMASIFQTLEIPVYAVLGNCDAPWDWDFYPEDIGVKILGRFGEIELAGKKIAMLHSDDEKAFDRVAASVLSPARFRQHNLVAAHPR
ncbi:MAG: metallophosphoesterase family protein [Kiritimatiellaeota bacterium]|nr:metallophosphoesterase family protein [Kiritimatiellota bacterium]